MQSLTIEEDKLKLIFKVIGVANARYNSALIYKDNLLISRGSYLKLCSVVDSAPIFETQIGNCQITQINENSKYIVVVNFDGLITFIDKENIENIKYQFRCGGKEIRHTFIDQEVFVVVAQVVKGVDDNVLEAYSISQIQKLNNTPMFKHRGHYYYPEIIGNKLYVQEYIDPNPVNKSRKDTVMTKKLPVENKLTVFQNFKEILSLPFMESDIVCTCKNQSNIFYLHSNKHISILDSINTKIYDFDASIFKSNLLAIQSYKDGIIFSSGSRKFSYLSLSEGEIVVEEIVLNTIAAQVGFCLKFKPDGSFYSFNDSGLHYYDAGTKKTYSEQLFDITNCGLALSSDSTKVVVGDFVGNVYIFSMETGLEIVRTFIGPPIRAIAWAEDVDKIVIGTTDGMLSIWNYLEQPQVSHLRTFQCSINCIKTGRGLVVVGVSHGELVIYDQKTLVELVGHKAHHPIQYENPRDRELFGSLQHFAEIWSVTISPTGPIRIASSSQDQTIRIFDFEENTLKEIHKLEGHDFAVTSVDWQVLKEGEVFVSCSDDKKVMVRNPNNNFQLLYEIETSTIKEWHTLTYLSLEHRGQRVFIGSQNGYLFIYNLKTREFQYANKINLGGIEGMAWNNKLVTCSSDLCLNIINYQ